MLASGEIYQRYCVFAEMNENKYCLRETVSWVGFGVFCASGVAEKRRNITLDGIRYTVAVRWRRVVPVAGSTPPLARPG